jgi:hypothetical protein
MCFPNLKVLIRAGFYLPAKWIKWLDMGDISSFTAHDGLHNLAHIIPIYASPLSSNDMPTGPMPQWFHAVLTGPHAQFTTMVECACRFDNWGVTVDLLCYREYDEELTALNTKIHWLQLDTSAIEQDHTLCEQCLEVLRYAEGLAHLEGLGPKSAHAKWGTCFTDDEDDDEWVCVNQCGHWF